MDYKQILREKVAGYQVLNELDRQQALSRTPEESMRLWRIHLHTWEPLGLLRDREADHAVCERWCRVQELWRARHS